MSGETGEFVQSQEWSEFISPDLRTLAWSPIGLGATLTPEQSVRWLQETIVTAELESRVPEELRRSYARLCDTALCGREL